MFLKDGGASVIRPYEVTLLVLYEIDKCLSRHDYETIELSEVSNYIFIKARKTYDSHLFKVDIKYDDVTSIVHTSVYCMAPMPKDKWIFCLKLINYINLYDGDEKYILCPETHIISCSTSHSILDCRCSIGNLIEGQASCSIENLSDIYDAIKNTNVKIFGIHPIKFYNYPDLP